jgi:hypothetical protein
MAHGPELLMECSFESGQEVSSMMSKGCVIFIDEIEQRSLEMTGNLPCLQLDERAHGVTVLLTGETRSL